MPRDTLPSETQDETLLVVTAQSCTLVATIFLILVLLRNTCNTHVLTSICFLSTLDRRITGRRESFLRCHWLTFLTTGDTSKLPNAMLVNSIAQTLGLRGFYQVGLWNYCEGYESEGVTFCKTLKSLYSFDPMTILLLQLLEGATSKLSISAISNQCSQPSCP